MKTKHSCKANKSIIWNSKVWSNLVYSFTFFCFQLWQRSSVLCPFFIIIIQITQFNANLKWYKIPIPSNLLYKWTLPVQQILLCVCVWERERDKKNHYCWGKKWKKQQSIIFTIVLNFSLWACLVLYIHYSAYFLAISQSYYL